MASRRTARDRIRARPVRRAHGGERPAQSGSFRARRLGRHDRPRRSADRRLDRSDPGDPRRPGRHRRLRRAAHGVRQRADRADVHRRGRNFVSVGGGSRSAGHRRRRGRAQWIPRRVRADPTHRGDAWNLPYLHRPHAHHCARPDRDRPALDSKPVRRALDRASARPRGGVAFAEAASVLRPADGGGQRRSRRLYRWRPGRPGPFPVLLPHRRFRWNGGTAADCAHRFGGPQCRGELHASRDFRGRFGRRQSGRRPGRHAGRGDRRLRHFSFAERAHLFQRFNLCPADRLRAYPRRRRSRSTG